MAVFHLRRALVIVLAAIVLSMAGVAADYPASPTEGITRYEHDDRGRIVSRRLPTGRSIRYQYADQGLPSRISYHRVGGLTSWVYPASATVGYEYDEAGNRTSMRDTAGQSRYEYDEFNRLRSATDAAGRTIGYEYDPWNRVIALALPGGARVTYGYDILNRITKVDTPAGAIHYVYEPARLTRTLPNGVRSVFTYTESGALASIQHLSTTGESIAAYQYQLDAAGRIAGIEEYANVPARVRYTYDAAGRLASVDDAQGSTRYRYDEIGNRVAEERGAGLTRYEYDAAGRLVRVGGTTLAYDAAGNVTTRTDGGGAATRYIYDDENRLIEAQTPSHLVKFGYDGDGHRIWRDVDGVRTEVVNDTRDGAASVAVEYRGDASSSTLIHTSGRVAEITSTGQTRFFLEDHLGSVRAVVDARGAIVERFAYTAFGTPSGTDGGARAAFAGEGWEPELGLLFLRRRFYDPALGRFLSLDPIGGTSVLPESFNRYVYAGSDPVNRVDPSGLQWFPPPVMYDPMRHLPKLPPPMPRDTLTRERVETRVYIDSVGLRLFGTSDLTRGHKPYESLTRWIFDARTTWTTDKGFDWAPKVLPFLGIKSMQLSHALRRPDLGETIHDRFVFNVMAPFNAFKVVPPPFNRAQIYIGVESTRTTEVNPMLSANARALMGFDVSRSSFTAGGGPPPPSVGGVYLDQAARVLGSLGAVTGVAYDDTTGQIVLLGDRRVALPPMKPEYLAAAIRAVYQDDPHEPGMTIDPHPRDPRAPLMLVIFFGHTANTRLGEVMFEADRLLKGYSVGVDNLTGRPMTSAVQGYRSITQAGLEDDDAPDTGLWSRFWLVPDPVTGHGGEGGRSIVFEPIRMRVRTETMRWEGGQLVSAGGVRNERAEAFARHFTDNYDAFAREQPVYAELRQVAHAVAIAKWMRQQGIAPPSTWLRAYAGEPIRTPDTTPAAFNRLEKRVERDDAILTYAFEVFGGVEMTPVLSAVLDDRGRSLNRRVTDALAAANREGRIGFDVSDGAAQYAAVAMSGPGGGVDPGGLEDGDADGDCVSESSGEGSGAPGFVRYYNSLHNERTEFGRSWSLALPRLEFEAAGSAERVNIVSVEGDASTGVKVQRFLLTDDLGRLRERFSEHFIDQGMRRIGFAPDSARSALKGVYPEADDLYRLFFHNGAQAVFDREGRLRAYFEGGIQVFYDYDERGLLSRIRSQRGSVARVVKFNYDDHGRVTGCDGGDADSRARYRYDSRGDLVIVEKDGHVVQYTYDDRHLLVAMRVDGREVFRNTYDDLGRLLSQQADGRQTTRRTEQRPDGTTVISESEGRTRREDFDQQMRLTRVEDGDVVDVRTYHANGNLARMERSLPGGRRSTVEYAADRSSASAVDPRGVRTNYAYGSRGELLSVGTNGREVASYKYDTGGRLVEVSFGGGGVEKYGYDADGRLARIERWLTDGTGDSLVLLYDEAGRPTGVQHASGLAREGSPSMVAGSVQRIDAQTLELRDGTGAPMRFREDASGQLETVIDRTGATTHYSYDAAGRLLRVRLANGTCQDREFDARTGLVKEERLKPCESQP